MKKLLLAFLLIMEVFTTSTQAADTEEIENFVSRFYTEVLGRTADTAGLEDWTNRLISGESTGADVATGFVFSDEFTNSADFKDDGKFIAILYRAFFDRDADADGFDGWLEKLEDGTSKEAVLNGFLYSQEFANLCEAYGIKPVPDGSSPSSGGGVEDFVQRFYQVVLGRTADAAGLADWVSRLNAGTATGADIAIGFIFSAEYDIASKSNEAYLDTLYKAFFDRDADAGGLSGWLAQLMQGVSREDVLNGFLHSQEFVNLAERYGIVAYSGAPIPEDGSEVTMCTENGYNAPTLDSNIKQAYLDAINAARSVAQDCGEYGVMPAVSALKWNDALYSASYEHSADLAATDTFSHTGSNTEFDCTAQMQGLAAGSSMADRATYNGYDYRYVGENIAAGYDTLSIVINVWLESDGHCSNMMNENYTEVGMALIVNENTIYKQYWAQLFGSRD